MIKFILFIFLFPLRRFKFLIIVLMYEHGKQNFWKNWKKSEILGFWSNTSLKLNMYKLECHDWFSSFTKLVETFYSHKTPHVIFNNFEAEFWKSQKCQSIFSYTESFNYDQIGRMWLCFPKNWELDSFRP